MEEEDRNRWSLGHALGVSNPAFSEQPSFPLPDLSLIVADTQFPGIDNIPDSVVSPTSYYDPKPYLVDGTDQSWLQELLDLSPALQQQSNVSPFESFLETPSDTLPSSEGDLSAEQLHTNSSDLPASATEGALLLQYLLPGTQVETVSGTIQDPNPPPSTASLSAAMGPSSQFQMQGDGGTYPRHLAPSAVPQVANSGSTVPDTAMFHPRSILRESAPGGSWTPQDAPSGTLSPQTSASEMSPTKGLPPNAQAGSNVSPVSQLPQSSHVSMLGGLIQGSSNPLPYAGKNARSRDLDSAFLTPGITSEQQSSAQEPSLQDPHSSSNSIKNTSNTNKAGQSAGTHWKQHGSTPGNTVMPNSTFPSPQSTPSKPLAGSSRSRGTSSLIPSLAAAVGTEFTPGVLRMPTESQGVLYDRFASLGQALWDEGVRWEGLVFRNGRRHSSSRQQEQGRSSAGCRGGGMKAEGHEGVTKSSEGTWKFTGREVVQSDRGVAFAGIFGEGQGRRELTSKLAVTLTALQQKNVRGSGNPVHENQLTALATLKDQGMRRSCSSTALTPGTRKPIQVGKKRRERGELPGVHQVEKWLDLPSQMQLSKRINTAKGDEWLKSDVRDQLLMLAEALHAGNMTAYKDLRAGLALFDDPKGSATKRIVHLMLMSLEMRREGSGFRRINTPAGYSTHMMKTALMWYSTAHPTVLFTASAIMSSVIPHILGKPKVHLVCFGYSIVSQLNVYMKLLSAPGQVNQEGQRQSGESGNSGEGILQRLRVTFIDVAYLHRPGRSDYKEMFEWRTVGPFLAHEANALNIDFQFQVLTLQEDNIHCLDLIQKAPGETLAVCDAMHLHDLCDDTRFAGGVLQHMMRALRRLEPVVMAIVEFVGDAGSDFLQRYESNMDYAWHLFSSHDACSARKGKRWQVVIETMYDFPLVWSTVACEGVERGFRPRSAQSWRRIFEFWGFELVEMGPAVTEPLTGFVKSFSRGFDVTNEEGAMHLTWNDFPLLSVCVFRPMRKCRTA